MRHKYDFTKVDLRDNAEDIADRLGCNVQTVYAQRRAVGLSVSREEWLKEKAHAKEANLGLILALITQCNAQDIECYASTVADNMDLSEKYTYKLIRQLIKDGLVVSTKKGRKRLLTTPSGEFTRNLKVSHAKLESA